MECKSTQLRKHLVSIEQFTSKYSELSNNLGGSNINSIIERFERLVLELKDRIINNNKIICMDMQHYLKYMEEKGFYKLRIRCPTREETDYIRIYLGHMDIVELIKRIGFNSFCICLECLHLFEVDLRDEENNPFRRWIKGPPAKDSRVCPVCGSKSVKTVSEIIGHICPRCKSSKITSRLI